MPKFSSQYLSSVVLALSCFTFTGCSEGKQPNRIPIPVLEEPTPTPTATVTPVPTSTPAPTNTPVPTSTPVPTNTPVPTSTPVPTHTPFPTPTLTPTPTPRGSACKELTFTNDFSVVSTDSVKLDGVETSGRVFGSSVRAENVQIGTGLSPNSSRFDVIASESVDMNEAIIPAGGVAYLKSAKLSDSVRVFGKIEKTEVLNREQVQSEMEEIQKRISSAQSTMKLDTDCSSGKKDCSVTLSGLNPDLNIGDIQSLDIKTVRTLLIDAPLQSTVIIRIDAKNLDFENFQITSPIPSERLILNFRGKSTITFKDSEIPALLLAPDAQISIKDSLFSGLSASSGFSAECKKQPACIKIESPSQINACLP